MGRIDLPDVYRDEDCIFLGENWRDSSVDSPCMAREAGDSIVLRATEEQVRTATLVIPHAGKCAPLLSNRRTRGRES